MVIMSMRRDPFEAMERMFEQMRRASAPEGSIEAVNGRDHGSRNTVATGDSNVRLQREGDRFVVVADLPGFERDELDLRYDDRTLTIFGTHEVGDGESYRARSVEESVRIPATIEGESIEASYTNGVLEVSLPVADDSAEGYRIEIN